MTLFSRKTPCFFLALLAFLSVCLPSFAARAEMEDYPVVKLQSLDKATARTMTFEAKVGSTVKFGPLYIKPLACRKAPPVEPPESAAFLQVWELNKEEKGEWIFSGWMFASSPSLSSMDHPIYDVWVLDCLQGVDEEDKAQQEQEEALSEQDQSATKTKLESSSDSEDQEDAVSGE